MKKKMSMRERAKQKAEKNMNRGGNRAVNFPEGAEVIKPKKGPYRWDIIPYVVKVDTHPEVEKGDYWYQRTFFIHFNVGPENKVVICPRTIKKPCPICEHVKELFNSGEDDDIALAKDIKAKERELYNIINLDDEDKGVQLLEMSYHLFGKALDEEIYEGDEELGGFAELEGGKTLVVAFRKKKLGANDFYEVRKIDFEDREDYEESILEQAHDLDAMFQIKTYEELQKELFGLPVEESEDEEEEEKPKPKKTTKKKKELKPDDDDDEEEEEEEEESKPKKKSKRSKKLKKSDKCPYGGTFGEDVDELDECEECEVWTECQEKSEE